MCPGIAALAEDDVPELVWKMRERLVFPSVWPGQWICLPFFVQAADGPLVFTDEQGVVLEYCRDGLYEAEDHELVWIKFGDFHWGEEISAQWQSSTYEALVYVYSKAEAGNGKLSYSPPVGPKQPEDVLPLAEFFNVKTDTTTEQLGFTAWQRREKDDHDELAKYLAVEPMSLMKAKVLGLSGAHLPPQCREPRGQALMLDPGMGLEVLCCPSKLRFHGTGTRVHLRAHFFDHLRSGKLGLVSEKSAHWLGIQSPVGSAAIGVTSEIQGFYAFLSGCCPDGSVEAGLQWKSTSVPRSCGWHLLELVFQDQEMRVLVDGEPIAQVAAAGAQECCESLIHLVAKKGDPGYWAGIELFHTPQETGWENGPQTTSLHNRSPWHQQCVEDGRWKLEIQQGQPEGQELRYVMSGSTNVPTPCASTSPPPPPPPPAANVAPAVSGGLAIECWSLEGESPQERVERAMSTFVEQLLAQGVIVPENISRVAQCGAAQHPSCYVYRFGTKRLHVAVQEAVTGRLALVVRVGGGFMDFAEFARRNGRMEQVRLNQTKLSEGRTVVHVTSVLSKGRIKTMPGRAQQPASSS